MVEFLSTKTEAGFSARLEPGKPRAFGSAFSLQFFPFTDVEMSFYRVLSVVLIPLCWVFLSIAEEVTKPSAAPRAATTNTSGQNATHGGGRSPGGLFNGLNVDSSMIQRALYVLIGITMIGVLYFLIRAVR